jgi:hypothetical protein
MAKKVKQKEINKISPTGEKQQLTGGATGFAFGKQNYKLLFTGLALIILGFILMIGGGSDDPNVFSDKIFNFRRLTLAPILVLAGYVIEIFAIMKKPAT